MIPDPGNGLIQALIQGNFWLPTQALVCQGNIRKQTHHYRRFGAQAIWVDDDLHRFTCHLDDFFGQMADRDLLAGAQVEYSPLHLLCFGRQQ